MKWLLIKRTDILPLGISPYTLQPVKKNVVNKLNLLKRNLFLIIDASLDLETVHFYGGRGWGEGGTVGFYG